MSGLHTREEWSAAIVRAATTAEIAANFAIRREFALNSKLRPEFVDGLLRWANGLAAKIDRLLIRLTAGRSAMYKDMKVLKRIAIDITAKRNAIAHQGGLQ